MAERLEGTFWGYQDAELFYQLWKPSVSRGTLVVTHGIAEHSDCYAKFAETVSEAGWTVFAWDLRGHGRSEGKRGYVNRFQDYCDDLDNAIRFVKTKYLEREKPLVLFGHSMGGLVTIKTLAHNAPAGIASLVLSSPALGLTLAVPKFKEKAATLLADWLPKITLHNEINFDDLVRDQVLVREYQVDPLRHDKISPRLFLGMVEAFQEAKNAAPEIHTPVLMQLAGHERVVSTPDSEKFFEALGSKKKQLYIYSESFHEIYNDLDRQQVFRDLLLYLATLEG
jgi:alpha-beta hydrolase superfamily lysophospholipase